MRETIAQAMKIRVETARRLTEAVTIAAGMTASIFLLPLTWMAPRLGYGEAASAAFIAAFLTAACFTLGMAVRILEREGCGFRLMTWAGTLVMTGSAGYLVLQATGQGAGPWPAHAAAAAVCGVSAALAVREALFLRAPG